jgi:hypothetical protein
MSHFLGTIHECCCGLIARCDEPMMLKGTPVVVEGMHVDLLICWRCLHLVGIVGRGRHHGPWLGGKDSWPPMRRLWVPFPMPAWCSPS